MPAARNRLPKYKNPKNAIQRGIRRVTKAELAELGYSPRSVLYTSASAKKPKKILTRSDVKKYQEPLKDLKLRELFGFSKLKRERIRSLRRKLFRHTYSVYSDYLKPISLQVAIELTEKFFEFLEQKHNPTELNQIGMIFKGSDDDFSIQPRLWRDRKILIIDKLKQMMSEYKAKLEIIFILGWIEQTN